MSRGGDKIGRIRSEAAWAQLCGVAPIPAGSGKTNNRHRLNPGGNRNANHALSRIVLTGSGNAIHAPLPTCNADSPKGEPNPRSSDR